MDRKLLKQLAIAFGVLLVIYWVTIPRNKGVNVDDLVQNVVFGFSEDDVHSVEIYKETGDQPAEIQLVKTEDQWRVSSHFNAKGSENKIGRFLKDLLEMTGNVRSSDPKHLENYKISDAQGIHVILKDAGNKPLANLIVGKRSEDSNSGFVRFSGFDKVYAVDKNLLSSLSISGEVDTITTLNQKPWVDLQAVSKEEADYQEMALVSGNKNVYLRKAERTKEETVNDSTVTKQVKEWVLIKGNREIDLDQKEVQSFFRDVSKIRGTEVVYQISNSLMDMNKINEFGFGRPTNYIVFQKHDGTRENVLFGKAYAEGKGYYMQTQEDGLVYEVSQSNYDKIFKWVEELPKKTT